MADINVTEEIIDINVTEEVITIEAPTGAYPFPNAVYSVFGRVGAIVSAEGDYNLTQLGDVTLTSPANGQVLKYNGTQWVNSTDADTGITTLNTLTALSQTFATGTSGTDFNIISASSTHTFNFPNASATNRGLLSSADWSTFNNKQNAITLTTTGTSGAATFVSGTLNIPQYQGVLTNPVTGTGTTNTLPKFTGASTIGNSNITDTGSLITLGSNSFVNGSLSIGNNNPNGWIAGLVTSNSFTGGTSVYGNIADGTIQSAVTNTAGYFRSQSATAAASFTLVNLNHFDARQATFGAGSVVTTQRGFWAGASLVGATNNYGFQGSIPAQANAWNLYMDGTASNYMLGNTGIGILPSYKLDVQDANVAGIANVSSFSVIGNGGAGRGVGILIGAGGSSSSVQVARLVGYQETASATANNASFAIQVANSSGTLTEYLRINNAGSVLIGATNTGSSNLRISKTITGGTTWYGTRADGQVQSDVTAVANNFASFLNTAATSFTLAEYAHYSAQQGTIGAGSIINNQYGFLVTSSLTGASNNYGFVGGLSASGTSRWNLYMNGTAPNYLAGSLGIGTTSLTQANLLINKNLTGSTTMYGMLNIGQVQSDVTTNVNYYATFSTAQNTAFTLGELVHYRADSAGGFGSATVTNQYGFFVQNSLTGATNDFGFYGNLAAATNVWNLFMNGTANNYMAGRLGIGTTNLTTVNLRNDLNITGGTSGFGTFVGGFVQSDVTSLAVYYRTNAQTATATFTLNDLIHFSANQASFGAGSTVTSQYGFRVESNMIGATNDYGFFGNLASGTNIWNLYMAGTASNYLAGKLLIGSTTDIPSASVAITSTTQGFLPPRMTTTQKLAIGTPAAGLMVYDTTLNQMSYYNGTLWINF